MDRRHAAGALLALAACIATTTAAPTASNNLTALDLYDGHTEGCYYNFRHYAEGDRIMTNEPCLNCTCHNRMLMCYLRVCPFTKAIGQDCTVEKRADQCCPIVTCPDVPVDLLTSTSTSSPAEYGSTGIGKVDNYGCTINGKYLPEGAKVPQTPGKPCEHCYCIRNMTTCVMQECTLHVDGCTPIYAKDVCCPIRYFCDHPDEEMLALDDMTTTVRPTPGFLLTTTTTTEEPTTISAKRDCVDNDRIYPDGALIKNEKPCVHCYCMKGDIVCVVQECGTPMENEGKNCTSLPPHEGQCCPDTYICEGDEVVTEAPFDEISTVPPRRTSVEGSGYRHDDEALYTEGPTFETEGSGEEESPTTVTPIIDEILEIEKATTEANIQQSLSTISTPISQVIDETTEPDKGLNTVPSGEDVTEPSYGEKTTQSEYIEVTSPPLVPSVSEDKETEPSIEEKTTSHDVKATEPTLIKDTTREGSTESDKTTMLYEEETTKPQHIQPEIPTGVPEQVTPETSHDDTKPTYEAQTTEPSVIDEKDTTSAIIEETSEISYEEPKTTETPIIQETEISEVPEMTTEEGTILREGATEPEKMFEPTTETETDEIVQPEVTKAPKDEHQDRTTSKTSDETTVSPIAETTTLKEESKIPEITDTEKYTKEPISEDRATTEFAFTSAPYEPTSTETSAPAADEAKATTELPEQQDLERLTPSKQPTTESFMELSTFAHVTEKESPTTQPTDIIESPQSTTLNPEENEIGEDMIHLSSPDQIPGEGDCLLNGITYTNNSVVPSTNKCHTGCKCFSSIIKCDPIMCSPPPDYMDNCQVTYDTPDACCPMYVCDHSKETIPPQPHSQMSGTETPTNVPEIECRGDECSTIEEKEPPETTSQTPESTELPKDEQAPVCSGDNCQPPTTTCDDGKCDMPTPTEDKQGIPCTSDSCSVDKEQTHCEGDSCESKPEVVVPQVCSNEEECKQTKVPTLENKFCSEKDGCDQSQQIPCEGEACAQKPETPSKDEHLPEIPVPPCEGDSCVAVPSDCTDDKCTKVTEPPQTSEQGQVCSDENGCKKPEQEICLDDSCKQKEHTDTQLPPMCDGSDCQQSVPVVPEEATTPSELKEPVTEQDHKVPTEAPAIDVEISKTPESEVTLATDEPLTSVPQYATEKPALTTEGSGLEPEIPFETPTEMYPAVPENVPQVTDETLEVQKETTPTPETATYPVKTPEESLTSVSDERITTSLPDSTVFNLDDDDTRRHEQAQTSTTSAPRDEEYTVTPEKPQEGIVAEPPGTIPEKVPIDTSDIETESPLDNIPHAEITTTESPKPMTFIPYDELPTASSETPSISVTEEIPDSVTAKIPQYETTTEVSGQVEMHTELTEPSGTSEAQDETITHRPEPSETVKPEENLSEQPQIPESQTEKEVVTDQPLEKTDSTEASVTSAPSDKTATDLPETPLFTSQPHEDSQTEVIEPHVTSKPDESHSEAPETPVTILPIEPTQIPEEEIHTVQPEQVITSAPELKVPTEQPLEPTAPQEDKHTTLRDSVPSIPKVEIQTESPETSATTEETHTEIPESYKTTKSQEDIHTVLPEAPITSPSLGEVTESAPESTESEKDISSSPEVTKTPAIPTEPSAESTTKAQETEPDTTPVIATDDQEHPEYVPEMETTTKSDIRTEEKISTETPEPHVTSSSEQDMEPVDHTTKQSEKDILAEEPTSPSIEDQFVTSLPVSVSDDKIQTETPLSLVTKPEETTSGPHISESELPSTEPELHEQTDEITEKPASKFPEDYEEPGQPITEKPVLRQPDQPEPVTSESPTEQPKPATEKEPFTNVPVIEEKLGTEIPVSTATEATEEEHETPETVPSETDTPLIPTVPSSESADITEVPEAPSATEIPEKVTISPEHIPQEESQTEPSITEEEKQTTPAVTEISGHPETPAIPSQESATETQTSGADIITEGPPEYTTTKGLSEEFTTKAAELEQPIATEETTAPQITPESDVNVTQLPETEPEHPEEASEQPTVYTTEHSEMITPEREVTHAVEKETSPQEPELPATEFTPQEETVVPSKTITESPISETSDHTDKLPEQPHTAPPEQEFSETTPWLVELEEHTHKIDVESSSTTPEEPTTSRTELHSTEVPEITTKLLPSQSDEILTESTERVTQAPFVEEETTIPVKTEISEGMPEKPTEPSVTMEETTSSLVDKFGDEGALITRTQEEQSTPITPTETEKPFIPEATIIPEKEVTMKPVEAGTEITAPEEEFIFATTKATTSKVEVEPTTQSPLFDKFTKPEPTKAPALEPEVPGELQPTDEVPLPEDGNFPPSGGYGQEPDYAEEDQAFGPGTCRYGGKVYVSAQQIPRDDPCDFCFCFRSDIICLQQSCPPPIHGCHEEPIQGFCCPRYECPVAMATTLNVTTTTTTTTTTLPPHFLPHAYKGAAQRRGCQIKGHTYKVGEVVRASSGPCLHCTCGGDGQMKCDPKACTPEPMLRQMIAAAVSAKRRR